MQPQGVESACVIGGGFVGLACALRLLQRGLRTVLVDPGDATAAASFGNAGHIAVEQVAPLASWPMIRSAPRRLFAFGGALDVRAPAALAAWLPPFLRAASSSRHRAGAQALRGLLERALPAWRSLLQDVGGTQWLAQDGHLVLWESEHGSEHGRRAWRRADIGSARLRDLAVRELDAFEPLMARRPVGGMRFEGTGQIRDLPRTLSALREHFVARGGTLVAGRVRTLRLQAGRAEAELDHGECQRADVVLVAAGVHSAALMATIGPRPPLIAERGYHVQWAEHEWPQRMLPVVFEDRSMILTRFDDGLRAAGFVEFARADSPPDRRKWAALRRHVDELGIPVRGAAQEWIGSRPTLPDYLPAIGRSPAADNLYYAFGHQHLGLTLAPITADLIAASICGDTPSVSLSPFDLQRFA